MRLNEARMIAVETTATANELLLRGRKIEITEPLPCLYVSMITLEEVHLFALQYR
jgi:hypothetical protein